MNRGFGVVTTMCAVALTLSPGDALGQTMASEFQVLQQMISGTTIEISYSRPNARGRSPVFGGVVGWGGFWTGANHSTLLEVSNDFELGGEEVPAGAYSVWLQPNESADWQLMLHADTSLYHAPHPVEEDGFLLVPVQPRASGAFVETLTFDLQNVHAQGADLVIRWGDTEVPVELGIGLDIVLTVEAEEAARYSGHWLVDYSSQVPSEEEIEEILQDPSVTREMIDEWLEESSTPQPLEIVYDDETGQLRIARDRPSHDGVDRINVLSPRAEGMFDAVQVWNGTIAYFGQMMYEFTFGEDGRAVSFDQRWTEDDELMARATRSDGEGGS
jgi:hypothetical protein